jgi:hypothetical protein
MRYTFKIPASDFVDFQTKFHVAAANKIMPRWLRELFGLLFIGAIFVAAFWITNSFDQAFLLTFAAWLIHFGWQKCFAFVRRRMAMRYMASLPDAETWTAELNEDHLSMENRGMRVLFPLSGVDHVFAEDGFLYVDFDDRGRARIPLTVFSSAQERDDFRKMVSAKKAPAP